MLNIPELCKAVKIISDTRHHHKRPLYFNIPRFNSSDAHVKIANLSPECAKIVENYFLNSEKVKENEIYTLIEEKLIQITELGLHILNAEASLEIVREYEFE